MFASVCKCINERETEREREGSSECVLTHAFVCVRACVPVRTCVRAVVPAGRLRQGVGRTDREREGGREGKKGDRGEIR